jgi:hypothetical protein
MTYQVKNRFQSLPFKMQPAPPLHLGGAALAAALRANDLLTWLDLSDNGGAVQAEFISLTPSLKAPGFKP